MANKRTKIPTDTQLAQALAADFKGWKVNDSLFNQMVNRGASYRIAQMACDILEG